jgi:condensin complex subunit 2
MAPIRAARAHPSRSYDDGGSESGDDTEPESTPQPKSGRTASKRRVSEFVEPDAADSSRASDGSRAPLQTVNINDDAAEKRRRRKSAKVTALVEEHGDQAQAGPSNEAAGAEPPVAPGRLQRLQSVAKVPVAETLLNPNPNHFEELIKLAADNVSTSPFSLFAR